MKVEDIDNDFHFAKRKHMRTWINTGLYARVWKAIAEKGDYADYDSTVKVDADFVLFLANCDVVDYGFFGNLECFPKHAVVTALMSF